MGRVTPQSEATGFASQERGPRMGRVTPQSEAEGFDC
jgi:hypothetical protein